MFLCIHISKWLSHIPFYAVSCMFTFHSIHTKNQTTLFCSIHLHWENVRVYSDLFNFQNSSFIFHSVHNKNVYRTWIDVSFIRKSEPSSDEHKHSRIWMRHPWYEGKWIEQSGIRLMNDTMNVNGIRKLE